MSKDHGDSKWHYFIIANYKLSYRIIYITRTTISLSLLSVLFPKRTTISCFILSAGLRLRVLKRFHFLSA